MTKNDMLLEATPLLIRALGMAQKVRVKNAWVKDEDDIPAAVERCWHDPLSDLDVEVWGVSAADVTEGMRMLGTSCQGNVLRLVTESGFRADVICHDAPAPAGPQDEFWFIAVQAIGKLLRGDYLISAHLAHLLLMRTLEKQMVQRDEQYGTNHHRYGYREQLNYLLADPAGYVDLTEGDAVHEHVAQMLVHAALCHDPQRAGILFAIWRQYLKEMNV